MVVVSLLVVSVKRTYPEEGNNEGR